MDYYKILKSEPSDDIGLIKKRYQELLLQHHPDKNGGIESDEFHKIHEAWSILSQPESRKRYDAELFHAHLSQDSAVWCTVNLADFRLLDDEYSYSCKCSGSYDIHQEDIDDLARDGDKDCYLACDSCSLTVQLIL
eukprot:TRINITY_DN6901_c0_g1_i4.p1 TRINITY_DN6901_c0_g1~~TRINITY_DN6901_c0_g1_i4.p1  ORF type:complete len:136 (+),score=30.99 TRINITY_DN6901_c0_g1_i4:59-466(+)